MTPELKAVLAMYTQLKLREAEYNISAIRENDFVLRSMTQACLSELRAILAEHIEPLLMQLTPKS